MALKRKVQAIWKGTGAEGSGALFSANGFFKGTPYSFKSRFENADGMLGTNPEELVAAAHSACFAMALSFAVSKEGFTPKALDVEAEVSMDKTDAGFEISSITLRLSAEIPGISQTKFEELAQGAKSNCPISKALKAVPIRLIAELLN